MRLPYRLTTSAATEEQVRHCSAIASGRQWPYLGTAGHDEPVGSPLRQERATPVPIVHPAPGYEQDTAAALEGRAENSREPHCRRGVVRAIQKHRGRAGQHFTAGWPFRLLEYPADLVRIDVRKQSSLA